MKKFRQVAIKAARLAGVSLMKNYKGLKDSDIQKKGRHDLVTKADFEANKIIIKTIKKSFPHHDFLSEETGFEDNPDVYKWIIDPLDGTTNYTMKNPLFCTAISLVCGKKILLSVIYAPLLKEFYYAESGKGAFLNGKRIRISKKKGLDKSLILIGRSHHKLSHLKFYRVQKKFFSSVLNMRRLGSGSLDLAYTAVGRVEACLLVPPDISQWDSLAGTLLVREAGGRVTNFKGEDWNFKQCGVIASNGLIHKRLLNLVKKWRI